MQHYSSNHVIVNWVNQKLITENVSLKIVKPRKRKLGDYRYHLVTKKHLITLNNDLDEGLFLLTFLHELAHKKCLEEFGRKVKPHGKEWKYCFQLLLKEGMDLALHPEIREKLNDSFIAPRATYKTDHTNYDGITVKDLNFDDEFFLSNSTKVFILKNKMRTRYRCLEKSSNKCYSISSQAPVTKCN